MDTFIKTMIYPKRPLILDILKTICLLIGIIFIWTGTDLAFPMICFIAYDVAHFIFIPLMFSTRLEKWDYDQNDDDAKETDQELYTRIIETLGGFPFGTSSKIIIIFWFRGDITFGNVFIPYLLLLLLVSVTLFLVFLYCICRLLICREEFELKKWLPLFLIGVGGTPIAWLWTYGLVILAKKASLNSIIWIGDFAPGIEVPSGMNWGTAMLPYWIPFMILFTIYNILIFTKGKNALSLKSLCKKLRNIIIVRKAIYAVCKYIYLSRLIERNGPIQPPISKVVN